MSADGIPFYDKPFYDSLRAGSRSSARRVVPLLCELIRPRRVVDVGCGVGAWLAVFREHGVDEVLGIDAAGVCSLLEIPAERFIPMDLSAPGPSPGPFDLAVSLEVAEHLPAVHAPAFVEFLARLAPVVFFSAAIPHQGGRHHVNEQWPAYWVELFARHRLLPVDAIRPRIWRDPEVEWWYAQNALLFVREERLASDAVLDRERRTGPEEPLALVHPRKYLEMLAWRARIDEARRDLGAIQPRDAPLGLVDDQVLDGVVPTGRLVMPFPERDGVYQGPPADDRTALEELARAHAAGIRFLAFAWPAFWWLDHYLALAARLRDRCACVLGNDRLVVFDLMSDALGSR